MSSVNHGSHEPRTSRKFDHELSAKALAYHDALAKPLKSLGRLEELAAFYTGAHGSFPPPAPTNPVLVIFGADHGVTAEGVTAFPSEVTNLVASNILSGGSAINALCKAQGVSLWFADVGMLQPVDPSRASDVRFFERRVASGTGNLARTQAMSKEELEAALQAGRGLLQEAVVSKSKLVGVGEIGIGNTTSAALLISAISGCKAKEVVGPGAGLDTAGVAHKAMVVEQALARIVPTPPTRWGKDEALSLLAAAGGLEIAAMVGFLLEAGREGVPCVLDGVVTLAAALTAFAIEPSARDFWVASHASTEPGAQVACRLLKLRPLLELSMRLGEGSGAVLGMALVKSAALVMLEMKTLEAVLR